MKIHFIISSLVAGGAERVLILLANYFSTQGLDVTIITFNEPETFKPNENVKRIRLHKKGIKNHTVRYLTNLISYYRKKENRPDIMIPFMTQTNFIAIIVSKIFFIKVISSEHNNHLKKTDLIGSLTKKYFYRYTDALTVLTKFDLDYYKKRKVNGFLMPNPCSFKIYKEKQRIRDKTILAVGDLNRYHHKGFDTLLKLIAPILKANSNWQLKLVGSGDKGLKFLESLAEQYNISKQVVFEGYSNNISELMRKSEIYIMTSRFEGLPMVLIEAMSQGMACISFDCTTGPSDIIKHNINGILVEDQNIVDMQKELEQLIKYPELRERLASMGSQSLDQFNIHSIYESYLDIFSKILKR
ncbi:glycosyltransferase family 4 protein [Formosa sp. A9]|uniref:glycosyltransferase family 4 protein n=1 Tax=Formosa sp. A9 TaxID=3442641 RepID=UPI003EBEEDA7